jgi:tetratricopeptide (TPR) repeat protein
MRRMTILLRCSALLFACALFALTQARAQKPEPPVYASGHYQIAVAVVEYESHDKRGGVHSLVSAFVGAGNVCGTIEFYGETPVHGDNAALKPIIETFRFNPDYKPQFKDVFLYGMLLYRKEDFRDAAPYLEQSIGLLSDNDATAQTWRRVATDNAGTAYGITGDLAKSRAIFEAAIPKDPDYPLYYYNLACADAEEKNLDGAKKHLQQAFDRKQNVIAGEHMPDPSEDDSFVPYKNDKEFWAFVTSLK